MGFKAHARPLHRNIHSRNYRRNTESAYCALVYYKTYQERQVQEDKRQIPCQAHIHHTDDNSRNLCHHPWHHPYDMGRPELHNHGFRSAYRVRMAAQRSAHLYPYPC